MDLSSRRQPIIEGAIELFLERPREEVSLAIIGDRIGMNYWKVGRLFSKPEQIYRAALASVMNDVADLIGQAPRKTESVVTAIRAYVSHSAEVIQSERYRQALYLLIRDQCAHSWLREEYEEKIAKRMETGLIAAIGRAGESAGTCIALRPGAARFVRELEISLVMPKLLPGYTALSADKIEAAVASVVRTVMSETYALEFETEAA